MFKIAVVLWVVLGGTFAGMAIMAVLVMSGQSGDASRAIPIAAILGALVAIPVSVVIAKRILALNAPRA